MVYIFMSLVIAYLIGSIPTAYIFGRILKGVDIREYGSGNVGATNVFRVVGKIPGIIALVLDILKGFVVIKFVPGIFPDIFVGISPETQGGILILLGGAAVAGHMWTIFLRFKGGKGVATTAGVMAGLAPGIFAAALGVWIFIFVLWKYVSLASIIAAISLPIFAVTAHKQITFIIFSTLLCMVGVYAHKDNIKRLLQGTEKKIIKAYKS